jgi:hypothetical protein
LILKSKFRSRNRNRNSAIEIEIETEIEIPISTSKSKFRFRHRNRNFGKSKHRNFEILTKITYNFVEISISSKVKKDFRGNPNQEPSWGLNEKTKVENLVTLSLQVKFKRISMFLSKYLISHLRGNKLKRSLTKN